MNIETLREYCISKKGATESFPFNEDILVFKVMGKAFALISLSNPERVNLKCEPEKAVELRECHEEIIPGWHMNKKHWNTVYLTGSLSNKFICELMNDSYNLAVNALPKKEQEKLSAMKSQRKTIKK
jgi:predicted DNA-binding protein (MmcQ/YjbR family)